mgnify:CR=1 FL=1
MYQLKYQEREPYYLELLTGFGLKPQEAKVYLACLKLGQVTVSQVAKDSGMQRTFIYDILADLTKRGIVSEVDVAGKKQFRAISIESFRFLLKEKFERFEAFIPELRTLEAQTDSPNVRFFEGKDGIKSVLQDTLDQPPGSEILCYSNAQGFYTKEYEFEQWYVGERAKRKIHMRFLAPDNPETLEYVKNDKKHRRTSRVVPQDLFSFPAEIDIYGNKVAIITLRREMAAMIIESADLADMQRMIFELAWRGAKETKRKD